MLDDIGVDAIQPSVLTPQPGTPLFAQMRDRIVDTNREHYDFKHAVFEPAGMTREELEEGTWWVVSQFYSPRRIARRAVRWLGMPVARCHLAYPLALNGACWGRARVFGRRGRNPARVPRVRSSVRVVAECQRIAHVNDGEVLNEAA